MGLGSGVWDLKFGVWCFGVRASGVKPAAARDLREPRCELVLVWCLVFGVWCLDFGVWGLGFGVRCSGLEVWGLGSGVWG